MRTRSIWKINIPPVNWHLLVMKGKNHASEVTSDSKPDIVIVQPNQPQSGGLAEAKFTFVDWPGLHFQMATGLQLGHKFYILHNNFWKEMILAIVEIF